MLEGVILINFLQSYVLPQEPAQDSTEKVVSSVGVK